jgi:hypothetical protein
VSLLALALGACNDATLEPVAPTPPGGSAREVTPLGLVEVTFSHLSSPTPTTSARAYAPGLASGVSAAFTAPDGGTGTGGIQLAPVSTGSFTLGDRGAGGVRYFYATYKVRNARTNGTAYTTERQNLTFLAVGINSTINGTAISRLLRFDGSAADPGIATQVTPTGLVNLTGDGGLASSAPDVLQVLTEDEAAAITASPAVTTVFPYGFVVSNPSLTNSRTLPANPAADQYDGMVTFAFKYPLQATEADDPFSITGIFLALDDGETRMTQSFEEQNATSEAAFESRASALGATAVTLLPGGSYSGGATARTLCAVRTAGLASAPTAYLPGSVAHFVSLSPDPYALAGQFVSSTATVAATFDQTVTAAGPSTFVINGSQSGRRFLGQTYTGNGTMTVSTPSGSFLPGEELEVTLAATPGLACPTPWVGRLRVAPTTSSVGGSFAAQTTASTGSFPIAPILADVNGDGRPDLVTANDAAGVSVLLNDGSGGFGAKTDYTLADPTEGAGGTVGDFDADGNPDIAFVSATGTGVSVLLGNGDGTFDAKVDYPTGSEPIGLVAADLNGDGKLDLATINFGSSTISVLLGKGDGTFQSAVDYPGVDFPNNIAVADFDNDGAMDLAVTSQSGTVSIFLGKGDGSFAAGVGYTAGSNATGLSAGDFDGNGKPDLAVASSGSGMVAILLGNGDGTFQPKVDYATGAGPQGVAVADLDGDGVLDLAVANGTDGTVSVLLGNGNGTFNPKADNAVGSSPTGIAVGDITGDGKLDLVVANAGDNTVSIIRRN